jgi:hypothetical protein
MALRPGPSPLTTHEEKSSRSVNESEIDEAVFAVADGHFRKVAMIIVKTAEKLGSRLPEGDEGDILIAKRIKALVSEGRLVAQGNVGKWRRSEVRLP